MWEQIDQGYDDEIGDGFNMQFNRSHKADWDRAPSKIQRRVSLLRSDHQSRLRRARRSR